VRRADNLTTFMCRLSKNLGASTSWSPKGLPRPVMSLLYLYLCSLTFELHTQCFTLLMYVYASSAQIPGERQVAVATEFCTVAPNVYGVLSAEPS
jgi:hypothetical protein